MTTATKTARIQMIENTLATQADCLSPGQIDGLKMTLATLRATLAGEVIDMTPITKTKAAAADDPRLKTELPEAGGVAQFEGDTRQPFVLTRDFVQAGKAIFTFSSPKGSRYTFKVERPDNFRGEFFASVMKGSDNEASYAYVGMMSKDSLNLRFTKGSKFGAGTVEAKVIAFALDIVAGRKAMPEGYELRHAGKCGRCARTLTTPESVDRGIGPECWSKMGEAAAA